MKYFASHHKIRRKTGVDVIMVSTSQQVQTSKDSPGGSGPSIEHLKMTRTLTNMHILKKDILGHSIGIGDNLLFT